VIHTMPDKTIRVTSRFPQGQSIIYFGLKSADGFTLEKDSLHPETSWLQMLDGYTSTSARYGSAVEAEADLADLNLMLADRHGPPLLPAASSIARRKRWGWTGAVAGLVLGAVGAYLVTDLHAANVAARASLHASLNDSIPYGPLVPPGPAIAHSTATGPIAAQQQTAASIPPAPPPHQQLQSQTQARAPAPAASFGLQP